MSEATGTMNFPNVSSSNLEGQKFNLPKDFEGKLNIVVIAFRRLHRGKESATSMCPARE
jgi:hypothetical protein